MPKITNDWLESIGDEFNKDYYLTLRKNLAHEYRTHKIFPPAEEIFNALYFTPLSKVKVLLVGQDPTITITKLMVFAFQCLLHKKSHPRLLIFIKSLIPI